MGTFLWNLLRCFWWLGVISRNIKVSCKVLHNSCRMFNSKNRGKHVKFCSKFSRISYNSHNFTPTLTISQNYTTSLTNDCAAAMTSENSTNLLKFYRRLTNSNIFATTPTNSWILFIKIINKSLIRVPSFTEIRNSVLGYYAASCVAIFSMFYDITPNRSHVSFRKGT